MGKASRVKRDLRPLPKRLEFGPQFLIQSSYLKAENSDERTASESRGRLLERPMR